MSAGAPSPGEFLTVPEPAMAVPDDRDWDARLRAGDNAAFEQLFRQYYEQLVAFASRMLGTTELAEEVVQDVFLSIWRQGKRGDLSANNISAYLFGAVRKGSTSRLRHVNVEKRWRERVSRGDGAYTIPSSPAADAEARFNDLIRAVRVVVDELPPRCRQAFLLRRQHGLSYAEIAQVMGIAPKTVEVQIGAALRTLRTRLGHFYE